jgi:hypothetical protein
VGIDLELADVAAARYRISSCRDSGPACAHDPDCEEKLYRLLGRGPSQFPYRQFRRINENMQLTGMGYEAEPEPWTIPVNDPDDEQAHQDHVRQTSAGGHRPCRGRLASLRSSSGQTIGGW